MADIIPIVVRKGSWITMTWSGAVTDDTLLPAYLNHNVSDIWIEAEGTFANGTSVGLTGYVVTAAATFACVDPGGTVVALTADGASPVRDAPPHFVPTVTSGSSDSVDVRIWCKVAS